MGISISGAGNAASDAALAASIQQSTIGAEIITKTLDTLNQQQAGSCSGSGSDMAASYDFQKSVLSAAYGAKGAVADLTG